MKIEITLQKPELEYPLLAQAKDTAQLVLFTGPEEGMQLVAPDGTAKIKWCSKWRRPDSQDILPPGTVVTLTV